MSYEDLFMKKKISTATMEYFKKKYDERKDKDNLFGVGMDDKEFVVFIINELLGEDWYCVDPIAWSQIVEIAFLEILEKYSPKKKRRGGKR